MHFELISLPGETHRNWYQSEFMLNWDPEGEKSQEHFDSHVFSGLLTKLQFYGVFLCGLFSTLNNNGFFSPILCYCEILFSGKSFYCCQTLTETDSHCWNSVNRSDTFPPLAEGERVKIKEPYTLYTGECVRCVLSTQCCLQQRFQVKSIKVWGNWHAKQGDNRPLCL